ncbi:tryptophan synthase subunit alpha [Kytococcus sedentarius]|uniref:tryptophan synthase subunit alpha n=1 Tax=Kytococcus sedentarius TaxID=1276 RepID=UPI0038798C41
MSNALESRFAQVADEGRSALVVYLPVGFPDVRTSCAAMVAAVEAGADVIEIGIPYTDPVMDGPVIQNAADRALEQGAGVPDALECARAVAAAGGVPVLMSYWNPLLAHGVEELAREMAQAGAAGAILPDLPPEAAGLWHAAAAEHGLASIHLVAPSTTAERVGAIVAATSGFVYAVSTMGVTGARASVSSVAAEVVQRVRAATDLPVCLGLGVSSGEQARQVAAFADGVIVGSAVVTALARDCGVDLGAAPAADPAAPSHVEAPAPSGKSDSAPTFPRMTALVAELSAALND